VHRRAALAAAATLVVAAAACGGSGGDKAGGKETGGKPVVLTLAEHDSDWGSADFAEAVEERSGGSIRIEIKTRWRASVLDSERRTVEDVRNDKVQMGIVGARVWDTLGVKSFRGLLAPFLVDSLELERRVLESPLAPRMLAGVERAGVAGIALLPGPLRRPWGKSRPLLGPRDYEGATIGAFPGRVEEATFRSFGATTRAYLGLHTCCWAGAALHPWGIADNGYEGKTLAANVVFWPRAETIVMNARAFERLTPDQQKILRDAGRAAIEPRLARIDRVEDEAIGVICARNLVPLVRASPADVAALHQAVRPVYAELERDPETRDLIAEIRKLDSGAEAEPLRCPAASARVAPELEGRWQTRASGEDLLAAGASLKEVRGGRNSLTLEFDGGRWAARSLETRRVWTGAYAVRGDLIGFTLETCSHNPCTPGAAADHAWSVYRDTLLLTRLPGRRFWWQLTAKPFKRAR
jgi:TRAP-type C4-dicarboxylate transport system substrate-binding protein